MNIPAVHQHNTGLVSSENWPPSTRSRGLDNQMTVADCWFAALDQRPFVSDGRCVTTRVVGVHLKELHTWIQLELVERPGSSFLLHLAPRAGLHDAVDIIQAEIFGSRV